MKRGSFWLLAILLVVCLDTYGQKKTTPVKKKTPATKVQKTNTSKQVKKTSPPAKKTTPPKEEKSTKEEVKEPVGATGTPERRVRDIVAFLEYVLNTLGSSSTPARDKDVLITESYSKIFRDGKVQVEDDLDEEREVITNKDVPAYLKDVDFFFTDVKFELNIEDIETGGASDNIFYKVHVSRNLNGTTVEGKTINNTIPRFIEINLNPVDQDLKIVSIYSNEYDEKDALGSWWNQLSYEWQAVFRRKLDKADSLSLNDIKDITAIQDLDLSGNKYIQTLEPLSRLVSLKSLNLSMSAITDVSALRNLTELTSVNLAGTVVQDISPLRYSSKLTKLDLNRTKVTDIAVVQKFTSLQYLDIGSTGVVDLTPISELTQLQFLNASETMVPSVAALGRSTHLTDLNVAGTKVESIAILAQLNEIKVLNLDSTAVSDLSPLTKMTHLQILSINSTPVANLDPLSGLKVERIYCDQTLIKREVADVYMAAHPGTLVIYDSKDLKVWWGSLPLEWRKALGASTDAEGNPTSEELARITNKDSINLSGRLYIQDLEPLRRLPKLKTIIASNTGISDLSPLQNHREIKVLDISHTNVSDVSTVLTFPMLKELRADNTMIQNIEPLSSLKSLEKLYVDDTGIHDLHAQEFLSRNTNCLIVYKTYHVERWWGRLSEEWKTAFRKLTPIDPEPKKEQLHQLVELKAIQFDDAGIKDLTALSEFVRVEKLGFSGTSISDLTPLAEMKSLKALQITNSPVYELLPVSHLSGLEELDISNTPVDDLKYLASLTGLKKLTCSGTQIRKLTALEKISGLEFLDCSNTFVSNLGPIENLPLKTLKCYNTKVSTRGIESFKKRKPDCNVIYYR